jgi:hypothetical protein
MNKLELRLKSGSSSKYLCVERGTVTLTVCSTCNMDAKTAKRVAQCNFSYFSAICAPDANPEGLRILCDWGNWVGCRRFVR